MFHYYIPQKDGAQIPAWLALRISTTPPAAGEKLRRQTNLGDCQASAAIFQESSLLAELVGISCPAPPHRKASDGLSSFTG
jgi:hypothetical protein